LWSPERTGKFKKQFKQLDPTLQKKVKEAIKELCLSKNPTTLGSYKKSLKVYAYRLDNSNRILYDVNPTMKKISFIRVGDHKNTYGKG